MRSDTASDLKYFFVIKSYDVPAINRAREIIEGNIYDHWSLGILASKAGINEFKLKVGFRQLFNDTPYQYLIRLRLKRASDLLVNTDLCLKEVAERVGFDSCRVFSRCFKKNFGILPKHYRLQSKTTSNRALAGS
jgi:transcriptional regulator GlxA family with amidase domain